MKVLLVALLSLSAKSFAGSKMLEVQARSTNYYDVETTFNDHKELFTSKPNGEQSHFKRYADQIDTFNSVTICYKLKSSAPKNPPNAKGMAVAVVNLYQNGKKTEILRDVSSWTGAKDGRSCTNYSFNLLADTRGNYKIVDFARDDEFENEKNDKYDDDDNAVAVMKDKNLLPNRESSPAASTSQDTTTSSDSRMVSAKTQNLSPTSEEKSILNSGTLALQTLNTEILKNLPPQIARYGIPIVFGVALLSLLLLVSAWRLFSNVGESGVYTLIPGLNVYTIWKISGTSALVLLAMLMPLFILALFGNALSQEKIYALSAVVFIGVLTLNLGLARRFGKGRIFGIGLLLMPWLFLPILAKSTAPRLGKLASLNEIERETDTYYIDDVS